MSRALVLRPEARAEFDAAGDWYEARRPGLGVRFVNAVKKVLDRIAVRPDYYALTCGGIREGPVAGFPFCIYYREEAEQVVVLSVFHTSRDPSVWQSRN